ncbi:MAG: shikimate kinase [Bacteroidetes bacterium]|nr:shikimate kinase [Bacteroidota bacterium]
MKIFLVGLPGSGKTTLGRQLAKRLNISFLDLDAEIENAEQSVISEIFSRKGEDYFRKAESSRLQKLGESNLDFVLSTGGGAPCFFDNMRKMNSAGKTIFLDVPTTEIMNRLLRTDLAKRPLFAKMNREEFKDKIEFMRSQRFTFYKQAKHIISGSKISVDDLVNVVKE